MEKSRKKIIEELIDDTIRRNIEWEVEIKETYTRAVYVQRLTPKKAVIFKLLYQIDDIKKTKLFVTFYMDKGSGTSLGVSLIDFGGRTHRNEAKELGLLLQAILENEGYE
jgi:hypothetical protein